MNFIDVKIAFLKESLALNYKQKLEQLKDIRIQEIKYGIC